MHRRDSSASARPLEWQPLVSARHWAILAHALKDHQAVLEDLRVVLTQLSPGVRSALVANLLLSWRQKNLRRAPSEGAPRAG